MMRWVIHINFESLRHAIAQEDHWLAGFNFNVEERDAKGQNYETLAICRTLALARAAFEVAIAEKPAGRYMIGGIKAPTASPPRRVIFL
jgi:hypothetical protein